MDNTAGTQLAAILVAVERADDIRRTLATLSKQTVAHQIELVLVAEDASLFDELTGDETKAFGSVQAVSWGRQIENVDLAAAVGIRSAKSPIASVIEDHVYLDLGWADAIIRTHQLHKECIGVGCEVALANVPTALTIANHLFALSNYTAPLEEGRVPRVSRHHVAYKRDWLVRIDAQLESLLLRGGGIVELAASEGGLYMTPQARLHHLTCADWGESLCVRLASGRLKGNGVVDTRGLAGRFIATCKMPLIIYQRIRPQLKKYPSLGLHAMAVLPTTLLLLCAEGAGYLLGVWAGGGGAYRFICRHEYHRERNTKPADLARLNQRWAL